MRVMKLTHYLVPALFMVGAGLASCDDEPSALSLLGGGCLLNSDCNDGLACVFQRCHIQCNTTEDCPVTDTGQLRCVVGEKPDHVCQLEDELSCSYNSECPGDQICGPDGECRDQCQDDRDCIDNQVCLALGVCADEDELDEDGELEEQPPPDGQSTGFPCKYDSDCAGKEPEGTPPFVCLDGGCNYECYLDIDCEPNATCEPFDTDKTTPGKCTGGGGSAYCVPGAQFACECYPPGNGFGVQICNDLGTGLGPCTKDEAGTPTECPIQ